MAEVLAAMARVRIGTTEFSSERKLMPEGNASWPFYFEVEWAEDAATLRCHGRLVAGITDGLYEGLKPLLGEAKRVVVDLGDVTYVDSTGVGVLVRLYVAARGQGCELKTTHLGKQVRNVLRMTHLLGIFGDTEGQGTPIH